MSHVFTPLAHGEAEGLALPGLGIVEIEHPVATRPAQELEMIGRTITAEIVRVLTGAAPKQ